MPTKIPRKILLEEKGTICCNCQQNVNNNIQYHHVVPTVLGGLDVLSNIYPLCPSCHSLTHNKKQVPNNFSDLVKAGIEKSKKEGRVGGRPKKEQQTTMALQLVQEQGYSVTKACKETNISRKTYYNYFNAQKNV